MHAGMLCKTSAFYRPSQRSFACGKMQKYALSFRSLKAIRQGWCHNVSRDKHTRQLGPKVGNYVFEFFGDGTETRFRNYELQFGVVDLFCIQAVLRGVGRTNDDIAEFQCNLATSVSDSYRVANDYASGTVFDTSWRGYLVS